MPQGQGQGVDDIALQVETAPLRRLAASLVGHHRAEPPPSWHPLWEWLGQPAFSLFFLLGAACALAGPAVALLPRKDPRPSTLSLD